jgi:predicted RecB family nuclease
MLRADWALSRSEERAAFERFIDFVMDRLHRHPNLHIYHFAPYEPAALKRLMGRYATREDELDQLRRGKQFVDLLAVVNQGLRASVESYSINPHNSAGEADVA